MNTEKMRKRQKYYFSDVNKEAIKSEIDIEEVLENYGIEINKNGFCCCPNPEHHDAKPSAKVYKDSNSVRCYSRCGKTFDVIEIIQMLSKCSFVEAMTIAVDDYNLSPECYTPAQDVEAIEEDERFPLEAEDIKLLGFKQSAHTQSYYTDSLDDYVQIDDIEIPFIGKNDGLTKIANGTVNLQKLWEENKKAFNALVYSKAFEAMEKVKVAEIAAEKDGDTESLKDAKLASARLSYLMLDIKDRDPDVSAMRIVDFCVFKDDVQFTDMENGHAAAVVGEGPAFKPLILEVLVNSNGSFAKIYELSGLNKDRKIPYNDVPPNIKQLALEKIREIKTKTTEQVKDDYER